MEDQPSIAQQLIKQHFFLDLIVLNKINEIYVKSINVSKYF